VFPADDATCNSAAEPSRTGPLAIVTASVSRRNMGEGSWEPVGEEDTENHDRKEVTAMVLTLISALLGGLLLLAGVSKLRDREGMLAAVQGYRLLPPWGERLAATVLPYAEVVLGVLLVLGLGSPFVPAAATTLFLVFLAGLSINLLRGRRELDCGCFAFAKAEGHAPRIGWFHAVRAAALAVAAAVLVFVPVAYGAGTTPLPEYLLGLTLAALLFAVGLAVVGVRAVINPGRRTVDDHLAQARTELRISAAAARP
jgi:hypothetical protein